MKKRTGFVSNSSSSSFIIKIEKEAVESKDLEPVFKEFVYERYDENIILTPKKLAKYAYNGLISLNEKIENCTLYSYTIKTLIKDNSTNDAETADYLLKLTKYIEEYGSERQLLYFTEGLRLNDQIENYYKEDFDMGWSNDNEYSSDEIKDILNKKYPEVKIYYDTFYEEEDSYEIGCEVSTLEDNFYTLYFYKDKLAKWFKENPGYYYMFGAEGCGNGWISNESNGIHETNSDLIFNDGFLLNSSME